MLFWIYNSALLALLPFISIHVYLKALFKKKRAFSSFFKLPPKSHKTCFWIHAVSLGEVITAKSFILKLIKDYPDEQIVISTCTETGFLAASGIEGASCFYLPLDLWFLQKKLISRLNPKSVIYIEGDIWPSLSYLLKKQSIKQVILSAKISEKSVTRFQKLPGVFQFLYGSIDYIFAQDQTIQDRFLGLQPQKNNVEILGNLKLIRPDHEVILDKNLEMFLNLDLSKKTVVIASTHEGEEFLILEALKSHLDIMNVILVPRHPQRFEEVKKILAELKLSFRLFSKNTGEGSIYFVDAIGHLRSIYKLAHLVILGGSFVKKIGGHNVMEPIFEKVPVLVGPYAFSQKGLVSLILSHQMGAVVDICDLKGKSLEILNTSSIQENILRFLDTTTLDLDHFFKTLGPVLLQDC